MELETKLENENQEISFKKKFRANLAFNYEWFFSEYLGVDLCNSEKYAVPYSKAV